MSPPMEFGKVKWNDSLRNITCLSKMGLDDVHLIIFVAQYRAALPNSPNLRKIDDGGWDTGRLRGWVR